MSKIHKKYKENLKKNQATSLRKPNQKENPKKNHK